MYYSFFGLSQPPFRITPDTDFFFEGGNRGAILEALLYAIRQGEGIVKVTGEVGSGKTMLCRVLQSRLPPSVESVYLANPSVSPEEILHAIAFELQISIARQAGRLEVMHALQEYLLRRHAEGKHVVVFVEEAQGMPIATLEEMRLLSNLETKQDKLLQIVLFGQPELDANLSRPEIRQLRERITHSFTLGPLSRGEIRDYLGFRLRAAGYRGPELFGRRVIGYLANASAGLTRRVNIIADKALLAAFADNTHDIRLKHVKAAFRDSEFSSNRLYRPGYGVTGSVVAFVLGGAGLACAYFGYQLLIAQFGPAVQPGLGAPPVAASASAAGPHGVAGGAQQPPVAGVAAPSLPAPQAPITDLLEQRLLATGRWLAEEKGVTCSIQLLGSSDPQFLRSYLDTLSKYIDIEKVFVYRTTANQEPSMTLLYGSFASRDEAMKSLAALPPELRANRPYVRTVQGIRAELNQRNPS